MRQVICCRSPAANRNMSKHLETVIICIANLCPIQQSTTYGKCYMIEQKHQNHATSHDVYRTISAMSRDCHAFILILLVCGIVLSQIVEQTFVRRDAGLGKVAIESKRNVLTFPCWIKPYSTPGQMYKVQKCIQSDSD